MTFMSMLGTNYDDYFASKEEANMSSRYHAYKIIN